ncbi:futalosine hydrolase [Desulfobulbus alkaliphilus]|uniref:futalosine hydrolase n=1 Tax=Desulfobulbus alkaliphilus TaxID=869814 RepID=UPI0019623EAF|nr:futalosine hydrolase [Desulfobulbus alkaliphilus]MBM9537360.1 futalosine hydrolase [Desulfobulbus alkaliphilus]
MQEPTPPDDEASTTNPRKRSPLQSSMYLITAATPFEMDAYLQAAGQSSSTRQLITGIGPVEAAVRTTVFLADIDIPIRGVINIGVAGAYLHEVQGPRVLDICLADREILGDFGICSAEAVEPLRGEALDIVDTFSLENDLLFAAEVQLAALGIAYQRGSFITVSCVSGSRQRGDLLGLQYQALCENMEGAAVARACLQFGLPLLELRCISNLVEDRDLQQWQLKEACRRCGVVAAVLVEGLPND